MSEPRTDAAVERFHATNGRISGYLGVAVSLVVLALAIAGWSTGRAMGVAILALLGLLLSWVVMLRPAMWATGADLVMRGMYWTDLLPLTAIDKVAVGQVTAVTAGGRRYLSPVIGYTARQTIRQRSAARRPGATSPSPVDTYQVFVEERISHLARDARDRYGATEAAPRRTYAWPEIAGTAVLVVAFLAWLLVL